MASLGEDKAVEDILGVDLNEASMVISGDFVMVMEEGERRGFLFERKLKREGFSLERFCRLGSVWVSFFFLLVVFSFVEQRFGSVS